MQRLREWRVSRVRGYDSLSIRQVLRARPGPDAACVRPLNKEPREDYSSLAQHPRPLQLTTHKDRRQECSLKQNCLDTSVTRVRRLALHPSHASDSALHDRTYVHGLWDRVQDYSLLRKQL